MSIDKAMLARMIDAFIDKYYEGDDKDDLRYLCQVVGSPKGLRATQPSQPLGLPTT